MDYSSQPSARSHLAAMGYRLGGWAGAGLMVSTLLIISPAARAETLTAWQFDPATQQLTLTLPSGITPQYTVEANPGRIVLTLPQTQLETLATEQTYSGAVSQIHLSQVDGATVIVLELAANAVLAADGASLIAIAAGDQTRWVLTALVSAPADAPTVAVPNTPIPGTTAMIVELPPIPGNDPRLGFPEAGTGRLSSSAANLMLPSDINNLTNLPETLPVDPFNLGRPGEQISVPSLAELDAAVGPVAVAPQGAAAAPPTVEPSAPAAAIATPPATTGPVLTLEPPASPGTAPAVSAPPVATPPAPQPEAVATLPPVPAEPAIAQPEAMPPIDAETSGVPIAVTPPELPSPEPPAIEPAIGSGTMEPVATESAVEPAALEPGAIAVDPPAAPGVEASSPAPAVAAEPPSLPDLAADGAAAGQLDAISQEPPPVARVPVEFASPNSNLLTVPTAPTTASQGTVVPPDSPTFLAAAGEAILFGSPLPNGSQAALPGAVSAPADRPLSPDTLVAAGTVLALRYVGNEPLDLNVNASQNQVLLLAQDIRDPITNGIVAPAGSQLIGQFEPTPQGQRWVSKMLIAPSGQQVDFASTTEYMVGNTDVSSPRLAAGAGLGALALLLLTGFSGIGLVGGALVGATTVVGTSPQHVVIEPNQVIQVQVIQDIPRAIPIAAAPEHSREWGTGGW